MEPIGIPFQEGDWLLVKDWAKLALVESIRKKGDRVEVLLNIQDGPEPRWEKLSLSLEEIPQKLERYTPWWEDFTKHAVSWEEFALYVEAHRLQGAYRYDPHYATRASQVDLLPHQVEGVYRFILPQYLIRTLLADDPGLGKTIQAGLILKELMARGALHWVLLIVPRHLLEQWQIELKQRFELEFETIESHILRDPLALQRRLRQKKLLGIVSMDTAKRTPMRDILAQQSWDMLIVDEAHKIYATTQGSKLRKTRRYLLVEALAPHAKHILFLTGTPHSGRHDAYENLLRLLVPNFQDIQEVNVREALEKGIIQVVRRTKQSAITLEGMPLFPTRETHQVLLKAGEFPEQRKLYEAVTSYVCRWYPDALRRGDWLSIRDTDWLLSLLLDEEESPASKSSSSPTNLEPTFKARGVALALMILQRRVSSSMRAIYNSLKRRYEKIKEILDRVASTSEKNGELKDYLEEIEDFPDDMYEKLESLTSVRTPKDLEKEVDELYQLLTLAQNFYEQKQSPKLVKLQEILRTLPEKEKVVIFTEFRDTLYEIKEALESWEIRCAIIHGQMGPQERQEALIRFREEVPILVATDAAGEGVNLQFSHRLINYDLPWNPMRLEQRIGRIHRYGQTKTCHIYHFIYEDTIEGSILSVILRKLETIRNDLGDSFAYNDLIGSKIEQLIEEAIISLSLDSSSDAKDEKIKHIHSEIERRVDQLREVLRDRALEAHNHIDLSPILEKEKQARLHRVIPWDTRRFMALATTHLNDTLELPPRSLKDATRQNASYYILKPNNRTCQMLGLEEELKSEGIRVVFGRNSNPEKPARLLAPGDKIFDAYLRYFQNCKHIPTAILLDPHNRRGLLWVFLIKARNGGGLTLRERLVLVFHDFDKNKHEIITPKAVWELKNAASTIFPSLTPEQLRQYQETSEIFVQKEIDELKKQVESERKDRFTKIIEWTRIFYEKVLENKYQQKKNYHERQVRGEDVRLILNEIDREIRNLEEKRDRLLNYLEKDRSVYTSPPQLLGVAYIHPKGYEENSGVYFQRRAQAMEEAFKRVREILLEEGWSEVEGPLNSYLGYNLKARREDQEKYGLIKVVFDEESLVFTPNEWQLVNRLGEELMIWVLHCEMATHRKEIYRRRGAVEPLYPGSSSKPFEEVRIEHWMKHFSRERL